MKKSTIGKLLIGLILIPIIYIQYIVLDRVLKHPDNLTEAYGIITDIQKIKIPKRYFGYNYAYALTIQDYSLKFAIHEKNKQAYDFIEYNNVQGKRIRLLYDKNGFNSRNDLTYHVYSVEINGQQILSMTESKKTDKIGLIIFFAFDLFMVWMIIYFMKKRKITKHNSC